MPRHLLPTLVVAAALIPPAPAAASCIAEDRAAQEARAEVIVEGEIRAARDGFAVLAVTHPVKGDAGGAELRILGAGGPGVVSSVDITPRVGEHWRILGSRAGAGAVRTNLCDGSRRIGAPAPAPAERPPAGLAALLGWLGALLGTLG